MRCDKCKKRNCRLSANHWRLLFFSMYSKEEVVCHEFEPALYHGLEDVFE